MGHAHAWRTMAALRAPALVLSLVAAWVGCDEEGGDGAGAGGCPSAGASCLCVDGSQGVLACGIGGGSLCDCGAPGATGGTGATTGGLDGMASAGTTAGNGTGAGSGFDGGTYDAGAGDGGGSSTGDAGAAGGPDASSAEDAGGGGTGGGAEVPDIEHCAAVADWDPIWTQWEEEVLLLTNEVRAEGANCDTEGSFGPAGALTMQAQLRCAARLHSMDMAEENYFSHTSQDGRTPGDRNDDVGYQGNGWGENIAAGQQSPQEVVDGWVDSDGHCANIMQPGFNEIGVGYYAIEGSTPWDGARMWTQAFGASGGGGGGGGGNFDPCDYVQLPQCP